MFHCRLLSSFFFLFCYYFFLLFIRMCSMIVLIQPHSNKRFYEQGTGANIMFCPGTFQGGQFWLWSESEIITLIAFTKCSTFSRRNWPIPIISHFKMLHDRTVLLLANYLSQHVSAYAVVRAMCQVNGGWSFSATWGSETPEPIHLKSGTFDYVQSATSRAKYGGRWKWGVMWPYWWSYTLACIF